MKLKSGESEVEIKIIRRSNPNAIDYWDGNWLISEVKVSINGMKAIYKTNFRADDFERFKNDLVKVKDKNSTNIEFTTMEEGLYLKGQLEIDGNVKWEGLAKGPDNNKLKFKIETG